MDVSPPPHFNANLNNIQKKYNFNFVSIDQTICERKPIHIESHLGSMILLRGYKK